MQTTRTHKKFLKDFEMKNLEEYHGLYIQIDTFLLADVFENFRNMCLEYTSLILQSSLQLQD